MPSRFYKDPDKLAAVERSQPERNVSERWTTSLMHKGWTPVSNVFLQCYSRLTPPITHGEAMFIVHLMQYKWNESAPFPSLVSIAKRMGISTTSARSMARSLQKKGYLHREGQAGRTNRYHLNRLLEALDNFEEPVEPLTPAESTDDPFGASPSSENSF